MLKGYYYQVNPARFLEYGVYNLDIFLALNIEQVQYNHTIYNSTTPIGVWNTHWEREGRDRDDGDAGCFVLHPLLPTGQGHS